MYLRRSSMVSGAPIGLRAFDDLLPEEAAVESIDALCADLAEGARQIDRAHVVAFDQWCAVELGESRLQGRVLGQQAAILLKIAGERLADGRRRCVARLSAGPTRAANCNLP